MKICLDLVNDNVDKKSQVEHASRWPSTVFEDALADVIQCTHKDCKTKHAVDTVIILLPHAMV